MPGYPRSIASHPPLRTEAEVRLARRAKAQGEFWRNAFTLQADHDLEVMRIENDAWTRVFGRLA